MNMEFGDKILTYLSSLGLGFKAVNLYWMQIPGTPHVCSAVIPTGGIHRSGDPIYRKSFTVLHRNTHINSGLCTINSFYAALNEKWNVLCPYEGKMTGVTEPGPYVRDTNNYVIYNLNFLLVTAQQG